MFLLVALVTASVGCAAASPEERSGYFLTYDVDLSKIPLKDRETVMNKLVEDVARGLLSLGVNDPIVAVEESNRFNVQIYGFKDLDKVKISINRSTEHLSVSLTLVLDREIPPPTDSGIP